MINVQCTTVAIKSLRPLNLFAAKFSHLLSSQLNLEACPSHLSQLSHYHRSHLVTFSFSPNFVSFHRLVSRLLLQPAAGRALLPSLLHYWSCHSGQRPRPREHRWGGGGGGRMVHLCVKTHDSTREILMCCTIVPVLSISRAFLLHFSGTDGIGGITCTCESCHTRETFNLDLRCSLPPAMKSSLG